jgi:hypothetical protein
LVATLREERGLRVFENRVLRGIFAPKSDEVRGEWIKLHNGEFHDMYFSPNIVRAIKSRRMRREGHVVRMWRGEVYAGVWWGKLRERDYLEDPGVGGRISSGSGLWEQGLDRSGSGQGHWRTIVNAVMDFMVTPCINDIKHFIVQLMHTTLKT